MSERLTVNLERGSRGFGFTLAGQGPCFLTNVTQGGVAWEAGLRSGDRVAGVGGRGVEGAAHGDVVLLLADAGPSLLLTIARPPAEPRAPPQPDPEEATDHSSLDSDSQVSASTLLIVWGRVELNG